MNMAIMKAALRGQELEKQAIALGVDISGEAKSFSVSGSSERATDHILQQRIFEVEREKRESKLFWVAILASVFSFISAVTAIVAVVTK